MDRKKKPQVEQPENWPDAIRCPHCGRWMVEERRMTYTSEVTGKVETIVWYQELNWDGYDWYLSRRNHSLTICEGRKQREATARECGFKNWKAFHRWVKAHENDPVVKEIKIEPGEDAREKISQALDEIMEVGHE